MGDPKIVWEDLKKAFGDRIGLWCKNCKPSAAESRKDCEHDGRYLWIFSKSSALEREMWSTVRERPHHSNVQLCRYKKCKRSKKCGKAHSESELQIWKILRTHRSSLQDLIITEEKAPVTTASKPKPKRRRKRHSSGNNANTAVTKSVIPRTAQIGLEKLIKNGGGGRFLFACKQCYNLEPRIVKEMEMGDGKDSRIHCSWCVGGEYLLLYEIIKKFDDGATFHEYQEIRKRLSTSRGNSLCDRQPGCQKLDECTYAHSLLEREVWEQEARGRSRIELVRYCNRKADKKRETLDGVFHCDRCCLSFSGHRDYHKYMGSNHEHFPDICRPNGKGWIFRPVPNNEFALCRDAECSLCPNAHRDAELEEWRRRVEIEKGRKRFRLKGQNESRGFDHKKRPEPIETVDGVEIKVQQLQKTVKFEDKTAKWEMKIAVVDGRLRLKRVGFPSQSDYTIRSAGEERYFSEIAIQDRKCAANEFYVLFKNPQCAYGLNVGDLLFEFDDSKKSLYYLRFEVDITGESFEMPERRINPNDWTKNRLIVRYQNYGYQLETYEKTIKDLEKKYPVSDGFEDGVGIQHITPRNYVKKMHSLLYREESARRSVLSRLNMTCELRFGKLQPNGHLFATFNIPTSVSTDEGLLFKNSCTMLYVGKESDRRAYECKKISWQDKEMSIELSPGCIDGLEIKPETQSVLQIQFQLDREPFCLRHYAVDNIQNELFLICPTREKYATLRHDAVARATCDRLDDVQNAVFNFLHLEKERIRGNEAKGFPPLIVAGPFGTGKTHTIQEILFDLLEKSAGNLSILLCTHTNSAADMYIKDSRIQRWGTKILRLFTHRRDPAKVEDSVKRFCLFNGRGGFLYPPIKELRKYKLVITTFATALALSLETGLRGKAFTHIFLDEASQVMEPDVIMPLLLADPKNTRILIAGDHRQTTERMYSDEFNRTKTLLERMYEAYENVSKRCRILLTNNYRCVDGILSLLTKLFYKENILNNAGDIKCIPGMDSAYFMHLKGTCIATTEGEYINESEAHQIVLKAKMLILDRKLVDESDVVVLSAFHSQVVCIRQILRRAGLRRVSVQTIQNVQGQQFKVVMLSCVMRRVQCCSEADGKNYGFLSDNRLLNTALTRAQSLIVVVGDAVTLCSTGKCEKYWKHYIKHCEENRTILPKSISVESVKRDIILAKQELSISADEFTPAAKRRAEDEVASEKTENDGGGEQEFQSETSSPLDDDNDSWRSEDSDDDQILDDMVKKTTGIDLTKITVGVGKSGDEYIQYGSEDDDDPNETAPAPSRRKEGRREAIYPKYTIRQLEQMLRNDGTRYKRCRITMQSWCNALATPVDDDPDALPKPGEVPIVSQENSSGALEDAQDDSDKRDSESGSTNEHLSREDSPSHPGAMPIKINPVICIETRNNVGRTFDQDEALVEIIGIRNDPNVPTTMKHIGKVLGVLKKRFRNPRDRHFLCRPDELNTALMCPFDKKLTKIAILAPKNHEQKSRSSIPIYKAISGKKTWTDLKILRHEKPDDRKVYVVRYLRWSVHCPYPLGFVEDSFDLEDFNKYLKLEFAVPKQHKKETIRQAKAIKTPSPKEAPIEVFTVDPEGSQDLDDAISFRKCADHAKCFEIGVHITDVASVVKEGSEIDKDAQRRFATFYGDDDPVHMLPEELSAGKCSILPNEVRSAISTFFHSQDGPPHAKGFTPVEPRRTFIRSTARLTYREAEELIGRDSISAEDNNLALQLREMWNFMWDWRVNRLGGEAFYKSTDTYKDLIHECRAHLLIEEAMISVNTNTASFLCERNFKIPMRVQKTPDDDKWTNWDRLDTNLVPNSAYLSSCARYLRRLKRMNEGADESETDISEDDEEGPWEEARSRKSKRERKKRETNQVTGCIDPIDGVLIFENHWDDMLHALKECDLNLFSFIAACDDLHPSMIGSLDRYRSIQNKSSYSSSNPFHFSLRIEQYAHSSSPIRRYIDIVIQRCVHRALAGEQATEETSNAVKRICEYRDDRHAQYEDKLTRAKLAESLGQQPRVFEACVTQITEAFLKIAIPPLRKRMTHKAREIEYGCLMLTDAKRQISDAMEDEQLMSIDGKIVLTSIELVWKLRYYNYEKGPSNLEQEKPLVAMKVPIHEWRTLVKIISYPLRISASEYAKHSYAAMLMQAADRIKEKATKNELIKTDQCTGETRNLPVPIKHKREIHWKTTPGTSVALQLSRSLDLSNSPAPAVQLFSIGEDVDVCVEHMRKPLDIFAGDAGQAKEKVKSLSTYRRKWEPLVRMDAANSAVKENSSFIIQGVPIQWKKKKEELLQEIEDEDFVEENGSGSGRTTRRVINQLKLKHRFCYDRYIHFHMGDLLCLRLKGVACSADKDAFQRREFVGTGSTYTEVVHGVITKIKNPEQMLLTDKTSNSSVEVSFEAFSSGKSSERRTFIESPENMWTIEVIPLPFIHRHMLRSLYELPNCLQVIQSICLGTILPRPVQFDEALEPLVGKLLDKFSNPLNEEQRRQEQRAVRHNFSVIQGPPGTGKSFMAAQIAAKFGYINKAMGKKKKVLYCGPSNKSVDVAAGFLKGVKDLRIVRMYSSSLEEKLYPNPLKPGQVSSITGDDGKMPDEKLKRVALHELIRHEENEYSGKIKELDARVKRGASFRREEMDYYVSIVAKAKQIELTRADIVICTCSLSCQLSDSDLEFSQCIIDECAMSSEPETILPLVTTNPNQVVLIGDHKQLKPVITCTKAERLGLGNSLFGRYTEFVGMLTNQYRMHANIMEFPSRQFYERKLTCDKSVRERPRLRNDPFSSKHEALFWNVPGEEKTQHFKSAEGGELSKYNMIQARAVIQILLRLANSEIPASSIMVLSPYTAQCARIREIIHKRHSQLKNIHVGTVVTSQGSEADFVILSTVRSLPVSSIMHGPNTQWLRKNLGFLTDRNQINVALTRARRRLFVIGNERLLRVHSMWDDLLTFYASRNSVFNDLLLNGLTG